MYLGPTATWNEIDSMHQVDKSLSACLLTPFASIVNLAIPANGINLSVRRVAITTSPRSVPHMCSRPVDFNAKHHVSDKWSVTSCGHDRGFGVPAG